MVKGQGGIQDHYSGSFAWLYDDSLRSKGLHVPLASIMSLTLTIWLLLS